MRKITYSVLTAASAIAMTIPAPVMAQQVNFGDDTSRWARDGECDDKRFEGAGMTDTPLLDGDIGHDATDCRAAYNAGRLRYRGNNSSAVGIIWGDDTSRWARDGECDDKRFEGPGMTDTPLLDGDIKHDATDCRSAYNQGRLHLRQ